MTRVLVTGSRDWPDETTIRQALAEVWVRDPDFANAQPCAVPTLVHGDCPTGADAIADSIARELGWHVEKYPADWEHLHKAAGPVRNQQMVDAGADACLAFLMPHSRGTVDCARRAERAGIPVNRWHGHIGACT